MKKYRKNIEQVKEQIRTDLYNNAPRYKQSIIRKFTGIYKGSENERDFINNVERTFKLSNTDKGIFVAELEITKKKIAKLHDDYFSASIKQTLDQFELDKMLAAYNVSFDGIEESIKQKMIREFRASVQGGYGVDELRKKLYNSGLGWYQAATEANTAIAQFDNNYHTQTASAAGINLFLYDGTIYKSRRFCIDHIGNYYTLEELSNMDNGQGLPVETSCGGYNCVHYLTAKVDD
ncbi:MAG: hypothetical protein KKB34_10340 [Bacteroidetes bacterium]|nr:hypothetical protein [Bacteroidota bacterium]